jgi:phosphoribosylformylglycinamidine cyclo-ligase
MPGMYAETDYDLAGFAVGIVERESVIDGHAVVPGDGVLGLASSGPHSNGYSLIRQVLEVAGVDLADPAGDRPLIDQLLEPTRIYVRPLLGLIRALPVRALAHITGGGITENLPRVLPPGTRAAVDRGAWPLPPVFEWLRERGGIADEEMLRTFNCGVGMLVVVAAEVEADATRFLQGAGETVWTVGRIERDDSRVPSVVYR